MIPRYSRPAMARLWEPAAKFRSWFEIEAHACDAQAALGVIPASAAQAIWRDGDKPYTPARIARIEAIEQEVKHDVIAFLTELAEHVGEHSRFLHVGLTSSDILDTSLALRLTRAADLLLEDLDRLLAALRRRAEEHKHTPCMGRSHGVHAEPMTFGLKLARFYAEFHRNRRRLRAARAEIATCALSGPVGAFSSLSPEIEARVAAQLGLQAEPISTQVIPRDRHAMFFAVLGVIAGSVENLAIEIRHLQRTELREVEEFFSAGQKGSSAMPHKRNPVLSENLTGLARLVRAAVTPALENIALWHERDISHSSVERVLAPDTTTLLDFALDRLGAVIETLVVYPEAMRRNLDSLGGLHHSQAVLLSLTEKGLRREDAYRLTQRNAMESWRSGAPLRQLLLEDAEVAAHLTAKDLDALFDPARFTHWVDVLFERVFNAAEPA